MPQTIISLNTVEQLDLLLPDWQQYGIQAVSSPEQLSRFQIADCILCLPNTSNLLLEEAQCRFPQSRFLIMQDDRQWLDGHTQQPVPAPFPTQTNTQPNQDSSEIPENTLLSEIFKLTAWDADSKDHQDTVNDLLYLAARRSKELERRAQQTKRQGFPNLLC